MKESSGDALLARPLRLHGIQLGRPVDLLLDRETLRVVGLDVVCGDDEHRFLPLATAAVTDEALEISSPLVLLEADELGFYYARAFALSSVRGRQVQQNGRDAGALRDVVVAAGGALIAVVLEDGRRLPFDETLSFAPPKRSAA